MSVCVWVCECVCGGGGCRMLLHLIGPFCIFAGIISLSVKRNRSRQVVCLRGREGKIIMRDRDAHVAARACVTSSEAPPRNYIVSRNLKSSKEDDGPLSDMLFQSLLFLLHLAYLSLLLQRHSPRLIDRSSWQSWQAGFWKKVRKKERQKERKSSEYPSHQHP